MPWACIYPAKRIQKKKERNKKYAKSRKVPGGTLYNFLFYLFILFLYDRTQNRNPIKKLYIKMKYNQLLALLLFTEWILF